MTGGSRPVSPSRQLSGFLARYSPEIRALARAARAKLRKRFPALNELVYDNYNALVIGYGPGERASDALFSLVLYPRWVTFFFLKGARLPDPDRILKGSGSTVRHVVLAATADLDKPPIRALMAETLARSGPPVGKGRARLVIKSVSAKQRPRRSG